MTMAKKKKITAVLNWALDAPYDELAVYNAECARGIVHTESYDARMAILQERWDKQVAEEASWEGDAHVQRRRRQIGL